MSKFELLVKGSGVDKFKPAGEFATRMMNINIELDPTEIQDF